MNTKLNNIIRKKASGISRRLPELEVDDLIQEANEVVVSIINRKGDIGLPYLVAAVNHHFFSIVRDLNRKRIVSRSISLEDIENYSPDTELPDADRELDRWSFLKSIDDPLLKEVCNQLYYGHKVKEIANNCDISISYVYKCRDMLIDKYKEWAE